MPRYRLSQAAPALRGTDRVCLIPSTRRLGKAQASEQRRALAHFRYPFQPSDPERIREGTGNECSAHGMQFSARGGVTPMTQALPAIPLVEPAVARLAALAPFNQPAAEETVA